MVAPGTRFSRTTLLSLCLSAVASAGTPATPGNPQAAPAPGAKPRAELTTTISGLQDDLAALDKSHQAETEAVEKLLALSSALSQKVAEVAKVADSARRASTNAATDRLLAAVKALQEMQMSFNLQYLMLQNTISQENRQFTMVSNIMRQKHDTVKNSINNVR